ncbi:MAG: alkaline phosphatase family protein [Candidatus Hydrogenedentota bacterium]
MITRREFVARLTSFFPVVQRMLPGVLSGALMARQARAADKKSARAGRVVILGFDGVEPAIVDEMIAKKKLPNLAALGEQGCYKRLLSSNPPQSPTAWSSFATCKNPGGHGIYDFLRRDPKTYLPGLGFGRTHPAKLGPEGEVIEPPRYVGLREGETFWSVAARNGARAKLLWVPYAYPPEDKPGITMLCGLDAPDIRGTQSTFFAFSDRFKEEEQIAGGLRIPLQFHGAEAKVEVPGLRHPEHRNFVSAPLRITVDRDAARVTLHVPGQKLIMEKHTWSDWLEWTFEVSDHFRVRAISRCYLHEAADHVHFYMTCLQIHPEAPYLPISNPKRYAGRLAEEHGLFSTVGWVHDTKALQKDELTEDLFLEEAKAHMAWQGLVTLDELEAGDFDLLMAGWTATDRVAHMFWRFRDERHPLYNSTAPERFRNAIEMVYSQMDAIIGKVMERLEPDDTFMVLSDHGFKSFHTGFSLNSWLAQNGYLAVKGHTEGEPAATKKKYLQGIDWPRTKAYGLGLGSLFLNLQGRESKGVVAPDEAGALLDEIRDKLLQVTDPKTGEPVLDGVYRARDVYSGTQLEHAPDLLLGFHDGYQMTKAAAAGAVPQEVLTPNNDKWSGEHAAADVNHAHGILFCNRTLKDAPEIIDLGVTTLAHLGIAAPEDYNGKSLLL